MYVYNVARPAFRDCLSDSTLQLEYGNERYSLLEAHKASLKGELQALREKTQQYSNALSQHQARVDEATRELLTTKERLTKAEIASQSLRTERNLLADSEKRAREQLEGLLREQKGQRMLLTNIQSIQNNLERTEFETKARLGSQIESLQREVSLQKEKLASEEERRVKVSEAYDSQVRDLDQRLRSTKDALSTAEEGLKSSKEQIRSIEGELSSIRGELEATKTSLQEAKDRNLRLERDAGGEFRQKIRLLERNVADWKSKSESLQKQLEDAKGHSEQYKSMSEANEEALRQLNQTSEEFKSVKLPTGANLVPTLLLIENCVYLVLVICPCSVNHCETVT